MTLSIGILASGAGTNFEAIADAIVAGRLDARIRILVCNRPDAGALVKATARGIPAKLIDHRDFTNRESFDNCVGRALEDAGVELVVMAGFDRIVTSALLSEFPDRVINIHPALLPAFRGADAQEQAWRYGVRVSGATVHIVDDDVDHGPIIIQAAIAIDPAEELESIRARILVQEHRIYPYAIQLFAEGRIRVSNRRVFIDGDSERFDETLCSPSIPR